MKAKEYYPRHSITISDRLAKQYANMRKTEILLHQYILSIVDDKGLVKRNLEAAARQLGCSKRWLYPAETSLTMLELIAITIRNSTRYWQVSEGITLDEAESRTDDEADDIESEEIIDDIKPKRRFRSWFRRLIWQVK